MDLKHLADTYFHLAIANSDENAIKQALTIYENLNIVKKAQLARQYYAFNIKSKTDYLGAIEDLHEIALDFEKDDDVEMCIYTFSRGALISLDQSDLERSAEQLAEAAKRVAQLFDVRSRRIAYYYYVRSRHTLLLKDYHSCISYGEKSGIIFNEVGISKSYADAMYLVAEAYGELGQFENAFKTQRRVSDTLLQQEVSKK